MALLDFYISFDPLSLFLFCELVFYCHGAISLFSFYVIILFILFVNSLSLESCTVFKLHPMWVIIDCIIPWLIINSCKPTSSLTLSLDGYIFVSMFSYSGKIYETFLVTSWLFFLFTYIAWCGVCCLDRKCTYCVWYSCWFDRMV